MHDSGHHNVVSKWFAYQTYRLAAMGVTNASLPNTQLTTLPSRAGLQLSATVRVALGSQ